MQVTTSWEEKGIEREHRSLVLLQLGQKVGPLPNAIRDHISVLSLEQLSALAVALLQFNSIEDLSNWLEANR